MSSSTVEGTVRFTPKRSRPAQRPSGVKTALPIALLVGTMGVVGLGWERAAPIAVVTAVVTVILAFLVLRNVRRRVSLTIGPDSVEYQRFVRTTTIVRDERMTALLVDLAFGVDQGGRYLLVQDAKNQVAVPTYLWAEDDLALIVELLGATDRTGTPLAPKQLDAEFPRIMPVHMRHPHRLAVSVIVIACILVIAVQALWSSATDDDARPAAQPQAVAPRTLPAEVTAPQQQLLAELKRVVDRSTNWAPTATRIQSCETEDGWQQYSVTRVQLANGSEDQATIDAATRVAARAGLEVRDSELVQGASYDLSFGSDDSEAAARVTSNLGSVAVSTTSTCVPAA